MTSALSTDRNAERTIWILAILMALGIQGFWWVWLRPVQAVQHVRVREPARMIYRPIREHAQKPEKIHDGVQAVWSPVLFSLPTSVGFSQPMFSDGANSMQPQLQAPSTSSLFLARATKSWPSTWAVNSDALKQNRSYVSGFHVPVMDERSPFESGEPARAGQGLTWRFPDGLAEVTFTANRFPAICLATQAWSFTVYLELDLRGNVAHAFLEKISDTMMSEALMLAIYQWRTAPAEGLRAGRVLVQYDGSHIEKKVEESP